MYTFQTMIIKEVFKRYRQKSHFFIVGNEPKTTKQKCLRPKTISYLVTAQLQCMMLIQCRIIKENIVQHR